MSRSAHSCPAASIPAPWSASWPHTATGRYARTPSDSREPPPTTSTMNCRLRDGSPICSTPSTTRSWCGPTSSRGYRRYLGNHYQAYLERLPGWARRAASALGERLPSDRHSPLLNFSRLAKGFLATAGMPFEERYRAYVQVFPAQETQRLLRLDGAAHADTISAAFGHAGGGDALNRMLAVDAETQLPDDLLMLTHKMSMATSLECRVPLLDHELVELAASMPEEVKIRGGRLKHILKEAVSGLLPRDILERKKRGFGTPMGAWLKGDLAPLVRGLLSESVIRSRELFHFSAVQELIGLHEANRVDGTDRLLALLNLEIWSRLYLDGRAAEDVTAELKAMLA